MKYELSEKYCVTSADVDFQQQLTFSALTNFLIQSAWKHAEILGWGSDTLIKQDLAWVLAGLHIQMDERPLWKEEIKIETWPKGLNKIFYLRDYLVYNSQKKIIGRATSNWVIINIKERRPDFYTLDNEVIEKNLNRHAIKDLIRSIRFKGDIDCSTEFEVRYSDVDLNQHLTTTRYVDFIFDTYSLSDMGKLKPTGLLMNFSREVKFGQKVTMQRTSPSNTDNRVKFQMVADDETKPKFLAELTFKERG